MVRAWVGRGAWLDVRLGGPERLRNWLAKPSGVATARGDPSPSRCFPPRIPTEAVPQTLPAGVSHHRCLRPAARPPAGLSRVDLGTCMFSNLQREPEE